MSIAALPENIWRIEIREEELRLSLVRVFMKKQRVLKTLSVADAASLPQSIGKGARNRVFLVLPREQGVVRQLQLPVDIQQDLRSALGLQIEAISAWPEPEVYWDFVAEKSPENPRMLAITVIIIPRVIVDPWLETFKAAGLPVGGASLSGLDANVLPPRLRSASDRVQIAAAAVMALALIALGGAFMLREPFQQRVYASQVRSEISRLEPEVKGLLKREAALSSLAKRYEVLLGHSNRRDANLEALNTLATTLPADTFILNYRYENDAVTVTGVSPSALTVQTSLEQTPAFKDVQLASPITRDPTGKERFALKMSIEVRP